MSRRALLDDRAAMGGKHHFTDDVSHHVRPSKPLPGEMPGIRDHLHARWNDIFATVVNEARGGQPGFNLRPTVEWEQKTLEQASLWWVSRDMVDVLLAAARSVPDDVLVTDIEPLDRCGLVVLEGPWAGVPSSVGPNGLDSIAVDAFLWGPVSLPPDADGERIPGVAISSYQWSPIGAANSAEREQVLGTIPEAILNSRIWFPLGRSDWPNADRLATCPDWIVDDQARMSFVDDRRVLCALMTLLAHGGIATTTWRQADRATRRRAQRAGDTRDQAYRVVTLRELRQHHEDDGTEPHHKVDHDHRWIVQGHWRRQPYGPGRSLRRLQWINPFIKGPEDMPLKQAEVIRAWRR